MADFGAVQVLSFAAEGMSEFAEVEINGADQYRCCFLERGVRGFA